MNLPPATLILVLAILPGLSALAENVHVLHVGGQTTGTLASLASETLKIGTAKGEQAIPLADIVELRRSDDLIEDFYSEGVRLLNGDRISGEIVKRDNENLIIETDLFGRLLIPLARLSSIDFRKPDRTPAPRIKGEVALQLANGDLIPGKLRWLDGESVGLKSLLGLVTIERRRITRLFFNNVRPQPQPGLRTVVRFRTGDRVTGRWTALRGQAVLLKLPKMDEVSFPAQAVSVLSVEGGRVRFLSDRAPSRVRIEAFLEGSLPRHYARDTSWGGRALRLGGTRYERGLGVHARTELTYSLGKEYETFAATIGLDDEIRQLASDGEVIFVVTVDGKKKLERRFAGHQSPEQISVPVQNATELRLLVDFAGGGDICDRADWALARLILPKIP